MRSTNRNDFHVELQLIEIGKNEDPLKMLMTFAPNVLLWLEFPKQSHSFKVARIHSHKPSKRVLIHSADKANPQPICADDGMTRDMQDTALYMHNYYR